MLQLIGFTNVAKVLVLKSYCLACEKARKVGVGKGKAPFSLSPPPPPPTRTPERACSQATYCSSNM